MANNRIANEIRLAIQVVQMGENPQHLRIVVAEIALEDTESFTVVLASLENAILRVHDVAQVTQR